MARLRVAHIITKLELGGAQQNTLYTAAHLNRERFEPILISGPGGMLDDEARSHDYPVHFIPRLIRQIRPISDFIALETLYRLIRQLKPHIVHTHSSKAGILGRIAAYAAGVPVVIHTYHGFGFHKRQRPLLQKILKGVERFCSLTAAHQIFVSHANRLEAEALGIAKTEKSSVIRSGIQFETPQQSSLRSELKIPDNAWVITSVGNFKPQKNPKDLLSIAQTLVEKDPAIHIVMAGDGPERAALEAEAKQLPGAERLHFLGWRRDIPNLLKGSDCFLLASLWEGLPRALVEAFSAKLPAVAYNVDGVGDILETDVTGYPIEPGQTAQAVDKLLYLKNNPAKAHEMGKRGYERVHEEFDINTMVRQQESLYEKLYAAVPLKELYGWDV